MKRSKIFLGITTGLLAIVGVTAAKARFAGISQPGYYKVSAAGCTVKSNKSFFTANSTKTPYVVATSGSSTGKILYSQSSANCSGLLLYTKNKD